MVSPLCCKRSEFQAVFNNLNLYSSPKHELIEIIQDKSIYYPKTKKGKAHTPLDLKTAEFVLCFFEANLECLLEFAKPISFFSKFGLIFQKEPHQQRFFKICEGLFQTDMVKMKEKVRSSAIQEAKKEHDILKNKIEKQRNELDELINDIEDLREIKIELQNTLILCQEGQKVYTHFKLLQNIPFFEGHDRSGMLKNMNSSITEEENKQFIYIFQFTDFSPKTIAGFLVWLKDPQYFDRVKAFEDLYENYRLADLLNHLSFQASCLERFKETLDHENVLKILAHADYYTSDPLIQHCCKHVADNFKLLSKGKFFLDIKHEYLIEILKIDKIYYEEIRVFKAVLKWAEAHQAENTLQETLYAKVNGRSLIDCIRFQHVSKKKYISYKHCFSTQDKEKWYEFYLQNKMISDLRCAPAGFYSQYHATELEIRWFIPMETYKRLKRCNEGKEITAKFKFKDYEGWISYFKSSMYENHLCIEVVLPIHIQFGFLIQVSTLRCYFSEPKDIIIRTYANGDRIYKACYFNLDELQKNVDLRQDFVPVKCLLFFNPG